MVNLEVRGVKDEIFLTQFSQNENIFFHASYQQKSLARVLEK
jgi:hypothetical protein